MYESLINNRFLNKNQLCLCRCPDWCEEGYQVAKWNGMKFEYEADPNGGFDRYVKAFIPLDADWRPCKLDKIHRYCPNCGASNTLKESVNEYTCRYCDGEEDTEY